jgi:cytokinin riboside 5'-monophosphate phosphoribohydrolase
MNICVFSSSSNALQDVYFDEARTLGSLIGKHGHTLINGGANVGLMEAMTLAALHAGARTLGFLPEKMQKKNLVSKHAHEVIITRDMVERKTKMREQSDAFIALPGGFGTLEEILEVLTLKQLAYHNKPVVFINTHDFFASLFMHFENMYAGNFSKEVYRTLYFIARDSREAIAYIEAYKPRKQTDKWYRVPDPRDPEFR